MHDSTYLESLMLEDDVRWVGEYAPFMRTTSDVLGSRIVHCVLASDVAPGNLAELSADFVRDGASNAWCSLDMCELYYDDGITPSQLRMGASHVDVLFPFQQTFDLMLHNNLADNRSWRCCGSSIIFIGSERLWRNHCDHGYGSR